MFFIPCLSAVLGILGLRLDSERHLCKRSQRRTQIYVPFKVWRLIFSFACTDDGTTGCSLSRVSRYIREASEPYRFQSIALTGVAQVTAFIDVQMKSPSLERRVQHLFICETPRSQLVADVSISQHPRQPQNSLWEWTSVLCHVLTINARSLRTLALCMQQKRPFLFSPIALPALEELSVYGDYYPYYNNIADTPRPFPRLSRLHIYGIHLRVHNHESGDYFSADSEDSRRINDISATVLAHVSRLAPSLTHLSICNDSLFNWDHVLDINSVTVPSDNPGEEIVPYFRPSLESIIFRPLPWKGSKWSRFNKAYASQFASLHTLAGKDARKRLIVLPPRVEMESERSIFEEAWTNWLDGVAGSARRWKIAEEWRSCDDT